MKSDQALAALGALAQETRLAIFRTLVKRGPEGYTPGALATKLNIPNPTMSFHLKELQRASLVTFRREGRFLNYCASFATMQELIAFLTEKCCSLSDTERDGACVAVAAAKRRA